MTLFIDNASFEKERLLHCVIAMRRVTRYTVYSVRGKEQGNMARYIVDSQIDNHEKYYFIREQESQDIVLLPSKYLMHKKRSKLSPNTIRRSAGAIS